LMSPETNGITKRNNIPVRLCCREDYYTTLL
jgi:hypothetical protein